MRLSGRTALCVATLLLAGRAHATEVVWLDVPGDALRTRVALAAASSGDDLTLLDLRAAATAWTRSDDAALEALDATLRDVRQYESRLDGELVIMSDLERPISAVTALRDDADRGHLFAALTYQGFAVDRFFADALATDDRAAPYRFVLNDVAYERPWADAVAIEPSRKVTAYEVAEAPQRVEYEKVREMVTKEALPVDVVFPDGLPAGGALVVDGRTTAMGPSGSVKLLPGRHLAHVEVDGRIVARYDLRLEVGETRELLLPVSDAELTAWEKSLRAGGAPETPKGLVGSIRALGDVVWVAWTSGSDVQVVELTGRGVQPVELPRAQREPAERAGGLSVAVGLGGGWFQSDDFYLQDFASVPRTRATVNAGVTSLDVDAAYDLGLLRVGAGVWTGLTLGADHVALTGDGGTRVRPYPYLQVGLPWVQATVGYLFPYHFATGLRATVPVTSGLEVQATGLLGVGSTLERGDGSTYDASGVYTLGLGVGWRFGG